MVSPPAQPKENGQRAADPYLEDTLRDLVGDNVRVGKVSNLVESELRQVVDDGARVEGERGEMAPVEVTEGLPSVRRRRWRVMNIGRLGVGVGGLRRGGRGLVVVGRIGHGGAGVRRRRG